MHPLLLNRCAEALDEPLALIFQKSFDAGQVPADWKTANVAPIFKKDPELIQATIDLFL